MCKWNIVKHEKAKYSTFLQELCSLNEEDEYSLHHEFSKSITEADENCVSLVIDYILKRCNPFEIVYSSEFVNIVTNTKIDRETADFLLKSVEIGDSARKDFYKSRLEQKSSKLFDTIPKTRKVKRPTATALKYDLNKETDRKKLLMQDCEIIALETYYSTS